MKSDERGGMSCRGHEREGGSLGYRDCTGSPVLVSPASLLGLVSVPGSSPAFYLHSSMQLILSIASTLLCSPCTSRQVSVRGQAVVSVPTRRSHSFRGDGGQTAASCWSLGHSRGNNELADTSLGGVGLTSESVKPCGILEVNALVCKTGG